MKDFMLLCTFYISPKDQFVSYFIFKLHLMEISIDFLLLCIVLVFGMSLFRAIMFVCAPIAFVKTAISLIHGYVASINIGIIDVKERQALRRRE